MIESQLDFDLLERARDIARFSPCETYRYLLTRELGGSRPLVICGLNPSTATAEVNDPTIRKEVGFARLWGCGRLIKVNAYAFRATDPKVMKRASRAGTDIVGPENDRTITAAVDLAREHDGIVVVAWGGNIEPSRQAEISYIFGDLAKCLGVNGDGTPKHPLYLPYTTQLAWWGCP